MSKKVAITGIGTINSIGLNVNETWQNAKAGKLGICELPEELTAATGVKFAGRIENYDANKYFDRKQIRRLDLATQYAIIASREAAADSKLDEVDDRTRIGVNVTSGIGGIHTIEENILKSAEKGFKKISPMFIPNSIVNLVAGNVAIELNANGLCTPIVTACASSTDAIGQAAMYIKQGLVDVMVAGGAEAAINKTGLSGFANMGALTAADTINCASIPFDKNRSGFVMGEGAATLILEDYDHALARNAKIYGFVSGYGATCDASHITAPDSTASHGLRAANIAIESANISKEDIGYVNAHGTSTPLNDRGENILLNNLFKDGVEDVVVTSSKSMTGHLLGATGALEALITVKSLNEQVATPTINTKLDPEINLNVATEKMPINTNFGMSFSLGFGGHNSVIILERGLKMELNSNQIQEIIPHRYPFLLVDKITDMEVGKYAVGIKAVSANEQHFVGHFPQKHVMPGVLIVEALAQVGAVCILSMPDFEGKIAYFAGIKNMRFKRQVIPGDVLTLKVEMTKLRSNIGYGMANAYVGDEIAATGELTFAIA